MSMPTIGCTRAMQSRRVKGNVIEALDAFDEIEMLGVSDDRITYLGGVNTSIKDGI